MELIKSSSRLLICSRHFRQINISVISVRFVYEMLILRPILLLFWFCGVLLKSKVYAHRPQNLIDLKETAVQGVRALIPQNMTHRG